MKFSSFVSTVIALAVGFAVGAYYQDRKVKAKYMQQAQKFADEQIEDVRKMYQERLDNLDAEVESKAREKGIDFAMQHLDLQKADGTSIYDTTARTYEIIKPEEFGAFDEYQMSFLTYYADDILAYDNNGIIEEDPERLVGPDALDNFGTYEADIVHVRNHLYRRDLEITRSENRYSDIYGDVDEEDG